VNGLDNRQHSTSDPEQSLTITAAVLLVVAAWRLWSMGGIGYHPYSFYQFGRFIVCSAWIVTAFAMWRRKIVSLAVISILVAYCFNPIAPIRMPRYQWPPYDHYGAAASVVAAAYLGWLTYRSQRGK